MQGFFHRFSLNSRGSKRNNFLLNSNKFHALTHKCGNVWSFLSKICKYPPVKTSNLLSKTQESGKSICWCCAKICEKSSACYNVIVYWFFITFHRNAKLAHKNPNCIKKSLLWMIDNLYNFYANKLRLLASKSLTKVTKTKWSWTHFFHFCSFLFFSRYINK